MIQDGIFLGYDKNIPLKNEGLGRLLAFLVSGWAELPNRRLTIACPYWLVNDLQSLLADHGVAAECYDLLRTSEPWWRKAQQRLKEIERKIRPTVHEFRAWVRGQSQPTQSQPTQSQPTQSQPIGASPNSHWLKRLVLVDLNRLANAKQWHLALIEAIKLGIFAAIAIWFLSFLWPVLLIVAVLFGAYRWWRKYGKKNKTADRVSLKKVLRKQRRKQKRYTREIARLIQQINQQQSVRHWLVPTPFWPEANRIEHSKSIVCPDLVLQEFPLRFADPTAEPIYARILDTLHHAQHLICYSQYTKDQQLVAGVGVPADQIDVIGHGCVELGDFIKLGKTRPDRHEQQQIALEFLRAYQRTYLSENPYWNRFAWDKQKYVLYSSQARGQKNILSLLRSIEILRHRQGDPVRLVLTCERSPGSELDLFVSEHRLDAWVLFAPGVSNQVLSSLYCWASLAVNPTLFEGGFPFTFTEAYSVGTPSLLSDIPMVREKIHDDSLRNTMLFDPLNPQDLADKIQWGLMHREQLAQSQRGLFEAFPTWTAVAQRYSESLRR